MKPLVATVLALVAAIGAEESRCPDGWVHYEYNCYMASVDKVPWEDARGFCRGASPGADLVSIYSLEESQFLDSEFGEGDLWIGLNDITTEGSYVWSNGEPATYLNWYWNNPDCDTSCNCMLLCGPDGSWCDAACAYDHPFICKMSLP